MCVSPDHIEPGSNNDNVQDRVAKSEHALNKLNKTVELSNEGKTEEDIATELRLTSYEVERLLDFNADDASIYEAEKQTLSPDDANSNRLKRLNADYNAVNGTKELISLERHVKQLGLNV